MFELRFFECPFNLIFPLLHCLVTVADVLTSIFECQMAFADPRNRYEILSLLSVTRSFEFQLHVPAFLFPLFQMLLFVFSSHVSIFGLIVCVIQLPVFFFRTAYFDGTLACHVSNFLNCLPHWWKGGRSADSNGIERVGGSGRACVWPEG